MHVRALIHLERATEALAVLKTTRVLPSEHARESHLMFAQAHTLAALAAYSSKRWNEAATHLTAALEWPEHLGQGKPYDPEERLIRFLLARVAQRRGQPEKARANLEAVIEATSPAGDNRLDLLAAAARHALGRVATAVTVPEDLKQSGDLDDILLTRALALPAR